MDAVKVCGYQYNIIRAFSINRDSRINQWLQSILGKCCAFHAIELLPYCLTVTSNAVSHTLEHNSAGDNTLKATLTGFVACSQNFIGKIGQ